MQEQITYRNAPLSFNQQGKGTAVILLHGFLENKSMWENTVTVLEKRNRVICIDLLGHGASENTGYIHSMDEMAMAVKAVLNHLKIRKVMFIGHSMGGYVALAFAALFPENTKGVCLLNSSTMNDSPEKVIHRNRAVIALKNHLDTFIKIAIPNLFAQHSKTSFLQEIDAVTLEALTTSKQGAIAATEGMKIRKNYTEFFGNSSFKKLVILGKEDPILDLKTQLELYKNSTISIAVLERGHMSHIESFDAMIHALKTYLK
ncbi:MAG: alpha/beta hydrolase [Flavobacteriaceae bacterium]|nr:alpha/beta hydrolase [Flavobacteriaceae bacterium]